MLCVQRNFQKVSKMIKLVMYFLSICTVGVGYLSIFLGSNTEGPEVYSTILYMLGGVGFIAGFFMFIFTYLDKQDR